MTGRPRRTDAAPRTIALLRPYRGSLLLAAVVGLAGAAASLTQPIVIGWVVGDIVTRHSPWHPFVLLLGLFAAEGVLGAVQVYLLGRAGNNVVRDVRGGLVSRLLRAPMSTHAGHRRGDLFSTTVADTSILGSALAQSIAVLMASSVMVLGSLGFMAYLDPLLTGAVIGCVVVAGVPTFILARRLRALTQHMRDRVGGFGAALERALAGISTVKLSRAEPREEARIGVETDRSYDAAMRATRVNAAMSPAMGLSVQVSFMVVFTVGAYRLSDGALTTGDFSAYVLYLLYLIAPLLNLFTGVAQFQQGAASAARVAAVLDEVDPEPDSASTPATDPRRSGQDAAPVLQLHDVDFGYDAAGATLHDVSFDVPRRGVTAIVGPSGAGKSTLFGLLVRLWTARAGRIELDGHDITQLPLTELRARIGYVEQSAAVFDGTLRDNLLYAKPDAGEAELDAALDAAGLRSWVGRLPGGLDTSVGEGGTAISGGERQRVVLARMLLTSPDVLLLDEATAHLDAESQATLHAAIREIARERAVVTIAHEMSTAAAADRVLVLDRGAVRAHGTHVTLLQSDELYRRLARSPADPDAARVDDHPRIPVPTGVR